MKKIFAVILVLCLLLLSTGCTVKTKQAESEQRYMVSSLAFRNIEDEMEILAEAIVVNSENAEDDQKIRLLRGKGKNVCSALDDIGYKLTKPLLLSHCGVIILEKSLTVENLTNIFSFCIKKRQFPLSSYFISSEDAEGILNCETISSVSVGYDIMSLIKQQSIRTGILYKNRCYELEASRMNKLNSFWVPFFKTEDEEYQISGIEIYINDKPQLFSDNHDALLYAMLTNNFSYGKINLNDNIYNINKACLKYDCYIEKNSLINTINLNIELANKNNKKELKKEIYDYLKNNIYNTNEDYLGIQNIVYKQDRNLWKKYYSDKSGIDNSNLNIKISVGEKEDND